MENGPRQESAGTYAEGEGERHDAPPFIVAIIAPTGAIKERICLSDKKEKVREGGEEKIEEILIRSVSTG